MMHKLQPQFSDRLKIDLWKQVRGCALRQLTVQFNIQLGGQLDEQLNNQIRHKLSPTKNE